MALAGGDAFLAIKRKLVHLAAKADHENSAEIRMAGIAGERAMQDLPSPFRSCRNPGRARSARNHRCPDIPAG
jgi:hypothetical protein